MEGMQVKVFWANFADTIDLIPDKFLKCKHLVSTKKLPILYNFNFKVIAVRVDKYMGHW